MKFLLAACVVLALSCGGHEPGEQQRPSDLRLDPAANPRGDVDDGSASQQQNEGIETVSVELL